MDLIGWYVLFAITTSFVSIYELWGPALQELSYLEPTHNMIEYKYITYIVVFFANLLLAPLVILPCLIPSFGERFRKSLLKAFTATY